MKKRGVLLLNLGSPDSTAIGDVRRYLREFLMDERVINTPYWIRWFIINFLILPTRPKNTAEAYQRIWTKDGSPLILSGRALEEALAKQEDIPIELGMRYGNPSTKHAVLALAEKGVEDVFVIPLYPHYAMASFETAIVKAKEVIDEFAPSMNMQTLPPFYDHPDYIEALYDRASPYLEKDFDQLLFSFHGIPEKHLRITDPTHTHCMECKNCCEVASPAHTTCYRHQCFQTVKHFTQRAHLDKGQYGVSFQSRLGRDPWLKPYTDFVLEELPQQGVKKLLVMSPAFVADNLETLEEIAMEGRETFLEAGGKSFELIPCLNESAAWIQFLKDRIHEWKEAP